MRLSLAITSLVLACAPAFAVAKVKDCAFFYSMPASRDLSSDYTWLLQACKGIGGSMHDSEWNVLSRGDNNFCGICRRARGSTKDHDYTPDTLGKVSLRCGSYGPGRCSA
ncbi:hypothetical protein B0J12DRAFT_705761 [Macrophomina phaseolina]|uniref:Cyanovirin-N domain-containing protein n=1 Tax=Macrophomina phaseolina TaxID=35725 RepID=A0ABQ8FR57_9PEZI|nr:hypothetical protein B0J12DRAFT_705761 [Macrophomina phaseolina]